MLLYHIWDFIVKFWHEKFQGILLVWGQPCGDANSLEWGSLGYWMFFFILFAIALVCLLCKSKMIKRLSKHILLLSFIVWALGVFIYIIGFYNNGVNGLSVTLRAIISSFKMFVVSHDLARVLKVLQTNIWYMTAFSIVHFAAAFITFLFIFKMLGYKIRSSWNLFWHRRSYSSKGRVVHIFWGVNEASCLLAESIRRNHATETIIFIDIDKEHNDNSQRKLTLNQITNIVTISNSEAERLDEIGAFVDHCYNGPSALKNEDNADIFGSLNLNNIGGIVEKSATANFYFLSDNEDENVTGALNLQRDRRFSSMDCSKCTIYVHARRDANNEILDHYSQYDGEAHRIPTKIIDSAYLAITTLKNEDRALPVNCVKINKSTGLVDSPFSALIVGFGSTGQEAFKFLYEYSAFIGSDMKRSPFKCYAIDEKMNKIAGLIRAKMPDIGEDELELIQTMVDSEEFWNRVATIIDDLNYVVIALNNDTLGLSLAVNLFKYSLKSRSARLPMLKIMVRCYDNSNERRMTEVISNLNHSIEGSNIEIVLFGTEAELYSCDTILSDKTLLQAKEFNRVYENSQSPAEEQWNKNFGEAEISRLMTEKKMTRYHAIYDINRRIAQNISNSYHCRTKMILMGFGKEECSERLRLYYGYVNARGKDSTKYKCNEEDAQLLLNMAMVEHERWIASHRLLGYTYSPKSDCVRRHHECLCPWENLDEKTQSHDCNVVDTTIKLAYASAKESDK